MDLSEFLQALPRKLQARVWAALLPLARSVVGRLLADGNASGDGDAGKKEEVSCIAGSESIIEGFTPRVQEGCEDVELLSGVVTICQFALSLESLDFASELTETLQIIHGTIIHATAQLT